MRRLFLILMILTLQAVAERELPEGWEVYSTVPGGYVGGRATEEPFSGKSSGVLRSRQSLSAKEHALLVQKVSAEEYRGFRMELAGYLRTAGIKGWAGLWVRVDDVDGKVLEFHNMMDAPVRGTTGWTRYAIAFDVPAEAFEIHFGALLSGEGEVRADALQFRRLGGTRPATVLKQRIRSLPLHPGNLDFEE